MHKHLPPFLVFILFANLVCHAQVRYPYSFTAETNPIVTHIRTADPDCHVWNDGQLWMYTSQDHDSDEATRKKVGHGYSKMDGYHAYSTTDLVHWTDHGEILHSKDVSWGTDDGGWMWAPGAAYKNGTYYLYFPHFDKTNQWKIGVATSLKPEGPFLDSGSYIEGTFGIDPKCFIDDDGTAYLYFAQHVAKLKDNMLELAETPREINYGANGRSDSHEDMVEAPWMFKRNGVYYFSYSNYKNKEYQGFYARGDNPYGPFKWKGPVNPNPPGAQDHHSIVKYKDKWYYFYHVGNYTDSKENKGKGNRRNVCVDELHFDEDGTMQVVEQTTEGVDPVPHSIEISGEQKIWHKITLDFDGPEVSETDDYNPFVNYRLNVTFKHEQSGKSYEIPGFFAADGNAANTSAVSGRVWRVHFSPDLAGKWTYSVDFRKGNYVAVSFDPHTGTPAGYMHGAQGELLITDSDKKGRDFRSKGRLQYVGNRYPQFSGSKQYFLKSGPDAPENLLSYIDFDGTFHDDGHKDDLVKSWSAHANDWSKSDPSWQNGKGKNLIGALNYIASKGMNVISFLTLNIVGDDQNVFPYVDYETFDRFDVSKLEQWEIVFDHAQQLGLLLHFKTQEMENQGLLDGGGIGLHRQLYYRELIARFAHHPALTWNLGEENGEWIRNHITPMQSTAQRREMARWFEKHDPYDHPVVIHNGYPFTDMLGKDIPLDGISMQLHPVACNPAILEWSEKSKSAGRAWMLANDEQGTADRALPPDTMDPDHDESRHGLWGTLLGGGWGNQWYFGYKNPHSDLTCEDWKTRDAFWNQCRFALDFFVEQKIPFWEMEPANDRLSRKDAYCFAKAGEILLVYVKDSSKETTLRLGKPKALYTELARHSLKGNYSVQWFNPKTGEELQDGTIKSVIHDGTKNVVANIGKPSTSATGDWVALVRKQR